MTLPIEDYSSFLTSSSPSFLTQVDDLVATALVTRFRIIIPYLKKNEGSWLGCEFDDTYLNDSYELPEDNETLYRMLKQEVMSLTPRTRNHPDAAPIHTVLTLPFDSAVVQEFLAAYRKTIEEELNPFIAINNRLNQIFEEILRNPVPIRILKRRVIFTYSLKEDPTETHRAAVEKDYSQECATCHAWRTTAHKLARCSGCLSVNYCNTACQKADWANHKAVCISKKKSSLK